MSAVQIVYGLIFTPFFSLFPVFLKGSHTKRPITKHSKTKHPITKSPIIKHPITKRPISKHPNH